MLALILAVQVATATVPATNAIDFGPSSIMQTPGIVPGCGDQTNCLTLGPIPDAVGILNALANGKTPEGDHTPIQVDRAGYARLSPADHAQLDQIETKLDAIMSSPTYTPSLCTYLLPCTITYPK